MKVCAMIQARMGSSRFPGKALQPLVGKPLLAHVAEKLQKAARIDQIYVLTSSLPQDDPIALFCKEKKLLCYRGEPEDVLKRYFHAAEKIECTHILRITADCPLLDSDVVDSLIDMAKKAKASDKAQLFTNVFPRTFPRGLDCELLSRKALSVLHEKAQCAQDREHVTLYAYSHPDLFDIHNLTSEEDLSFLRVTVDEKLDLTMLEQLYKKTSELLGKRSLALSTKQLIKTLKGAKELQAMNASVHQVFADNCRGK